MFPKYLKYKEPKRPMGSKKKVKKRWSPKSVQRLTPPGFLSPLHQPQLFSRILQQLFRLLVRRNGLRSGCSCGSGSGSCKVYQANQAADNWKSLEIHNKKNVQRLSMPSNSSKWTKKSTEKKKKTDWTYIGKFILFVSGCRVFWFDCPCIAMIY